MSKISVVLADGTRKEYDTVDEWRADVDKERASGKSRYDPPKPTDHSKGWFARMKPSPSVFTKSRKTKGKKRRSFWDFPSLPFQSAPPLEPEKPDDMSMAGLKDAQAKSTLERNYKNLKKKKRTKKKVVLKTAPKAVGDAKKSVAALLGKKSKKKGAKNE